jgi:hypothetical protein
MNFKLGSKVRDSITGFTGIATSKHEYLNGCIRISITPPVDKEGKMQEPQVFDIQQIEVVEEEATAAPVQVPGLRIRPSADVRSTTT